MKLHVHFPVRPHSTFIQNSILFFTQNYTFQEFLCFHFLNVSKKLNCLCSHNLTMRIKIHRLYTPPFTRIATRTILIFILLSKNLLQLVFLHFIFTFNVYGHMKRRKMNKRKIFIKST